MALLPAHLMRSVAGGYDNESVAVAAICSTFFLWVRSQRTDGSWWVGALAGLSYHLRHHHHPETDQKYGLTEIHLRFF